MEINLPNPGSIVRTLEETFLSYTIDVSFLLGGRWWGSEKRSCVSIGSTQVSPLDLKNPDLIRWASYLSPAYLRIGGTEADRVYYRLKKKDPFPERPTVSYQLVLKKKQWKQILSFTKKVGAKLVFTLNCGWSDRTEGGEWDSTNAQRLIAYTARKKLPVVGWELGNEVNGYPFIEGFRYRVSANQYVKDFQKFSLLVKELHPGAKAIGPASAFWPKIGEPHPIIPKLLSSGALAKEDVVSWHYYPFQSSRGVFAIRRAKVRNSFDPKVFEEAAMYVGKLQERASGREIWLTETAHALYGGERGISDTYVSTPWWLDLLGRMASMGIQRVFRQTLVGSDYGLLDPETFDPRPDYYASFLWKRLMGNGVISLPPSPSKRILWYCHTTKGKKKGVTYLLINLNRTPVSVRTEGMIRYRYVLKPAGPLQSHYLSLNDTLVEPDIVTKWKRRNTKEKYKIHGSTNMEIIPPLGCAFLVVKF
ncbi:MAG: glycoside hydrolase [Spirochaetes bacterium]|nr:glycoside hydrolase [Spirochaetota bacterium]